MDDYTAIVTIKDPEGGVLRTAKLKRLMPYSAAKVVAWLDKAKKDAQTFAKDADITEPAQLMRLQQYRAGILGGVVGKLWADEALSAKGSTDLQYGVAVFDELLERGWSEVEIESLAGVCSELAFVCARQIPDIGSVNAVLDFGEAQKD